MSDEIKKFVSGLTEIGRERQGIGSTNDTEHRDFAVCPHCGYEECDSFEFQDSEDVKCARCGNAFHVERHMTITYSTTKMEGVVGK